MEPITAEQVLKMLAMSEGTTLDFKKEQYKLTKAEAEAKSEFVKDVLAFANTRRETDAHILVGVAENTSGPATVVGVDQHIDDSNLQQLVNSKTNRDVKFRYYSLTVEDKEIGVVLIAKEQNTPLFLKKKFGRLEPNVVFVRLGSSTKPASPDDIVALAAKPEPTASLELEAPQKH